MIISRRHFIESSILLTASGSVMVHASEPAGRNLDFKIANGFGAARTEDVRAVLLSVASSIWEHCPNTRWDVPGFYIYHCTGSPITLNDHRSDGCIAIGLTPQGNLWSQFAYQFAHEFCHALAGHSNDWRKTWITGRKANHWLEEALCETASLYALRAMGSSWRTLPPYPNWKSYAVHLVEYAQDRIDASARKFPADMSFIGWFRANEPSMRENSTIREKNNIVASRLLPLFEARPEGWEAVTFCNLGKRDPEKTLAAHFSDWHFAVPPAQRSFIGELASVFEIKLA